jgi:transposase-like protein
MTGRSRSPSGATAQQTEGAKFWLKVMNEIKTRGVNDVQIAVVDGLKSLPSRQRGDLPRRSARYSH